MTEVLFYHLQGQKLEGVLTPLLEKAVRAAKGAVKLVKMNIDEHPQIPGQMGVQSIPAVFAFQDGRPVSVRDRTLKVEKVGFERALYLFAHERPWLYGLVSAAIALAAGWVASRAFRRS